MPCGYGLPTAEDCAVVHWSPALDGRPEGNGWRAPCPVKACPTSSGRVLEYSVRGKSIRWNTFCKHHDRDATKEALRELLGPCMPSRVRGPRPVKPDDLAELALSGITSTLSLKLALLEMSGMPTPDALDKLGIRRENRSRIIAGARIKSDAKPQVSS